MSVKRRFFAVVFLMVAAVACSKQQYALPEASQQLSQDPKYNNKVDILMMVDNSSSMLQYQQKLSNEIPEMLKQLNQFGMDYHIVVVNSDMNSSTGGKFIGNPKVLSGSTPDVAGILSQRVLTGESGSDLERGMDSIKTALSESYLAGAGSGFLRSDALLVILSLSNDDDHSSVSTNTMKTFLEALKPPMKGFSKSWLVNYIGIPSLSSGCSGSSLGGGSYRNPGTKWIDLANASDGRVEEICQATLAQSMENIRKRIIEVITDYQLGRAPIVSSIHVVRNGQPVPQSSENGWEYISDGHILRFHGNAVPGLHDVVTVDFTPASAQ